MSIAKQIREPRAEYLALEEPALLRGFELLATAESGVAALRELVLTLALHGKMVSQFGSDEPADVLLSRIRSSPPNETHVTNFTSERPFEVPSSWVWATLGEVIDVVRGITFPANQKTREPASDRIACLRTTNVQSDVEWSDLLFVDRSFVKREEQIIQHLDIVMSMANSKALVGKVALVEEIPWPEATIGGFLSVLRPRLIDARYVMIVMRSQYARSALIDSASQTTNIANISLAKLRPLPFPLPPLAEQRRIVARVEELMTLCNELEARGRLADEQHTRLTTTLFEALTVSDSAQTLADNWRRIATHFDLLLDRPQAIDALEQTILQLAVRGLLVPQDASDEPASKLLERIHAKDPKLSSGKARIATDTENPLPATWRWTSLESIAVVGTGTTPTRTNPLYFDPPSIPWVTSGETRASFINEAEHGVSPRALRETSLTIYPPGTLIVAMYGQGKTRGQISELLIEATTNQACAAIRLALPDTAHRKYIKLFFEKIYDEIREKSAGGAQPNLNVGKIKATPIPLPPLAEQHRIVTRVEHLRRLCDDLRERLNKVRATKTHLAETLVTEAVQP